MTPKPVPPASSYEAARAPTWAELFPGRREITLKEFAAVIGRSKPTAWRIARSAGFPVVEWTRGVIGIPLDGLEQFENAHRTTGDKLSLRGGGRRKKTEAA